MTFDLIVSDIGMRHMDGSQPITNLRQPPKDHRHEQCRSFSSPPHRY